MKVDHFHEISRDLLHMCLLFFQNNIKTSTDNLRDQTGCYRQLYTVTALHTHTYTTTCTHTLTRQLTQQSSRRNSVEFVQSYLHKPSTHIVHCPSRQLAVIWKRGFGHSSLTSASLEVKVSFGYLRTSLLVYLRFHSSRIPSAVFIAHTIK